MSTVAERIASLGLVLPAVTKPLAAYVPAIAVGNLIMTSGQLPIKAGELLAEGKVGAGEGLVSPERAAELAAVCALNAIAAIADQGCDLDRIRIVKLVGFVASDPDFTGQPLVINGASELMGRVFGERGSHARSAVGVASLPLNAPVEVEVIAEVLG